MLLEIGMENEWLESMLRFSVKYGMKYLDIGWILHCTT